MTTFFLLNNVKVNNQQRFAGTLVDDQQEDANLVRSLGGVLIPSSNVAVAAAAVQAQAIRLRGGDPNNMTARMLAAYNQSVEEGAGQPMKDACNGATTPGGGNIADLPSVSVTQDGVTHEEADRFLVKNQTDQTENGIYVFGIVAGGNAPLTRSLDADTGSELSANTVVPIRFGTVNADTAWKLDSTVPVVIGTTPLPFTQIPWGFAGAGVIANVNRTAAGSGSSGLAARADHKHDVDTAAPTATFDGDSANSVGSATTVARSDHGHAFADVVAAGAAGLMTGADKTKPNDVQANAQVNDIVTPDGSVWFTAGGAGVPSGDNANLFWDDVNNRLGVGTNAPITHLHIAVGNFTLPAIQNRRFVISDPTFATMALISEAAGSGQINFGNPTDIAVGRIIYRNDTNQLGFGTNSTSDHLIIDANGNVGIGLGFGGSPTALLHESGTLSDALTGTVSVTAGTDAVTGVNTLFTTELAVGDAIKIGIEVFTVLAITNDTSLTLDSNHVAGASGVTAFRDPTLLTIETGDLANVLTVTRTGHVGIGTTSPTLPLDVVGGATISGTALIAKVRVISVDDFVSTANAGINFGGANKTITFETDATERMRIASSGNIGIGTDSPSSLLHVQDGAKASAGVAGR